MKKASKLVLSVVLILTMLMSTISVSATSSSLKSEENWEQIYDYQYSSYSVKIYRSEKVVEDIGIKIISTKYKFIADGGKYNNVEYITGGYLWSLGAVEYSKYVNDLKYRYNQTGEILNNAIKADKYLTINYFKRYKSESQKKIDKLASKILNFYTEIDYKLLNQIFELDNELLKLDYKLLNQMSETYNKKSMSELIDLLKYNGFTHLCYNCLDACTTKRVCRRCKGDLKDPEAKKTICLECKKSNTKSLAKVVCDKCGSVNIESKDSLW